MKTTIDTQSEDSYESAHANDFNLIQKTLNHITTDEPFVISEKRIGQLKKEANQLLVSEFLRIKEVTDSPAEKAPILNIEEAIEEVKTIKHEEDWGDGLTPKGGYSCG